MKRFSIYIFLLILISLVEAKPAQEYIQFGSLEPGPLHEHKLPMVFGRPRLQKLDNRWLVCSPSSPTASGVWEEIDIEGENVSSKLLDCGKKVWKDHPAIAMDLAQQSLKLKDTPAAWSLLGAAAKGNKPSRSLLTWIEERNSTEGYRCLAGLSQGAEAERWKLFARDRFKALTQRAFERAQYRNREAKLKAYTDYLLAIEYKPKKEGELQFPMGKIMLELRDFDSALIHFSAAGDNGNQDALVYKGDCLVRLEGFENSVDAMLAYKKATGPLAEQRKAELKNRVDSVKKRHAKFDSSGSEFTVDTAKMKPVDSRLMRTYEAVIGGESIFLGSIAREFFNEGNFQRGCTFALDCFKAAPSKESLKLVMEFHDSSPEVQDAVFRDLKRLRSTVSKIDGCFGEWCLAKLFSDHEQPDEERNCMKRIIQSGNGSENAWEVYVRSSKQSEAGLRELKKLADSQDSIFGYEQMLRLGLVCQNPEQAGLYMEKAKGKGSVLALFYEFYDLVKFIRGQQKENEPTEESEKLLQEKMFPLMGHVRSGDPRVALYARLNLYQFFVLRGDREKGREFFMRSHYLPVPTPMKILMPIPRIDNFDEYMDMLQTFKGDLGYAGDQPLQAHMRTEAKAYLATIVEKVKQGTALTTAEHQMLKAADEVDGTGIAGIITQVEREQAEREKREEEERLLQEQRLETAQGVIDSCISDVVTQAEREQAELEKKEEEEAPSGLSPWDGGEEYMNRSWADMMDEHDRKQSN